MKVINYRDYNPAMGILIDIRDPITSQEKPFYNSTNIYYEKLLMNYKTLLNKNQAYYIICGKGKRSKEVVRILEFYGYNVTQVIS